MYRLIVQLAILVGLIQCGCMGPGPGGVGGKGWPESFRSSAKAAAERLGRAWGGGDPSPPSRWQWATALPQDVRRAELFVPEAERHAVAHLIPELRTATQPAAATLPAAPVTVIELDGQAVRTVHHLHAAAERAVDSGRASELVIADPMGARIRTTVPPDRLIALAAAAVPDRTAMEMTDEGNPWIVFRQDGLRCRLLARLERHTGLLQLIIGVKNCWGPQRLLPVEVTAFGNRRPLRCLTASQALERLYAGVWPEPGPPEEAAQSFAAVSERPDYLVPTNFQRLCTESQSRRAVRPAPLPALATLPGIQYPGPAVLGDARAVAAFLLRRQLCHPDDPELVGWVLFDGSPLRPGGTLEVYVDLGAGHHRFAFLIPRDPSLD
ncbi:MAG TPA: hypothetical protein EYH34_07730 [Planctomycetes bacterium]|nr:hypothetical protein [Planctomycetota bacterium]